MRAVLLYSAAVHIAALGLLAAFAMRTWLDARRPKEFSFPEMIGIAGLLGAAMMVVATILTWPGRGFGAALLTGIIAGLLGAAAFMLCLGAWPERPSHGGPPSRTSRITGGVFVGTFLALELVAFLFLAGAAVRA